MNVAKQEMLARIRDAHARARQGSVISEGAGIDPGVPGEEYPVPRDYIRERRTPGVELIDLLVDRLVDYRAEVIRCDDDAAAIGEAVSKALADHGVGRVGIPVGLDESWLGDVDEVVGDGSVRGLKLKDTVTGEISELPVTAMFVAIGHDPRSQMVADQVDVDESGYVKVASPSTRTSLPGVFAAGDLVDSHYQQAITAAGTGCTAAIDAEHYLASLDQA